MRDMSDNIKATRAYSPVASAGTGDTPLVSEIADLQGFDSCTLLILTGTLADAGATFTVLIEDGDASDLVADGGAVVDAQLIGTEAAASFSQADDNKVLKIGYVGNKRYVRATITPSGNAAAAPITAVWVLGHASVGPQSTQKV